MGLKKEIYQRYGFGEIKEWYYYDEKDEDIYFEIDEIKEKDLNCLEEKIKNDRFYIMSNEYFSVHVSFDKEKKFDTRELNDKYGFIDIDIEFESNVDKYYFFDTIKDIYNKNDSTIDILRHIEKCVNYHMIDIVLGFLKKDLINGELY